MRDRPIGVVTATGYGHTAGRNLTWPYADPGYDIPGTVPAFMAPVTSTRARLLDGPVWVPDAVWPRR